MIWLSHRPGKPLDSLSKKKTSKKTTIITTTKRFYKRRNAISVSETNTIQELQEIKFSIN